MSNRTTGTSHEVSWLTPLASRAAGFDRVRRAVDVALRCLGGVEPTKDAADLVDCAERLRDEIEQWSTRPPSAEMQEAVMRGALSIQMRAMALHRRG